MLCKIMAANCASKFFKISNFIIFIVVYFFHFRFGNKEIVFQNLANPKKSKSKSGYTGYADFCL